MLSVADARAALIEAFAALPTEDMALADALGRVLAEDLRAVRDQPPFATTAMDGYAFAASAAARDYVIVGEAAAGHAFARALGDGEAVRISTGAPLPAGADAVLAQEDAQVEGGRLTAALAPRGQYVRPRAGDFAAGDVLLGQGRRLDPIALALAAAAGRARVQAVRRPRVDVIAGGDEIVPPGQSARDDQIYESGSFAVCGLIEAWGGAARRGPVMADTQGAIEAAVQAALARADLVVLIGGASVGPHDHARAALTALGFAVRFDKVRVRPGKPTWFASGPHGAVLGLPGNPASAIVCALLFLKPVLEAMLGAAPPALPPLRRAVLGGDIAANDGRESYARAQLDEHGVLHVLGAQDSSLLSVFAKANALVMRAPNAPAARAGEVLPYLSFER